MTTKTKTLLISGLVSGITYACIMAGFDYYENTAFRMKYFIFNVLFFGGMMSYLTYRGLKNNKN